ncbi:MAG: TlpA disulfide reductase family protein, partial [Niabella sp.]
LQEQTKASVRNVYTSILIETKRFKEALPLMEEAIIGGASFETVKSNLKTAYAATYGSEAGFGSYEKWLQDVSEANALENVKKQAISMPAHDFELKDVDGNTVKLSDLKGKVVVLDFWATWCGPCKASFPMMQKTVNKYKDDPNVQFLFLHTWDKGSGDPTAQAKKYIVSNNYTFHVLMDLRDPETQISTVAKDYKVEGIPTKIIIDTKGNIRFITSGFSDQEDLAIKEISTMIEFAKTNH